MDLELGKMLAREARARGVDVRAMRRDAEARWLACLAWWGVAGVDVPGRPQ